jgi:hypothetical protein
MLSFNWHKTTKKTLTGSLHRTITFRKKERMEDIHTRSPMYPSVHTTASVCVCACVCVSPSVHIQLLLHFFSWRLEQREISNLYSAHPGYEEGDMVEKLLLPIPWLCRQIWLPSFSQNQGKNERCPIKTQTNEFNSCKAHLKHWHSVSSIPQIIEPTLWNFLSTRNKVALLQCCSITYFYFNIADFTWLSENGKNVLRNFPKLWWTWVRKAIKEKNWSKTRNNIWQSSKNNSSLMSSWDTLNEIQSNNYLDIWYIFKNKTDLKNWNERKKWNNDDSEKERKKERESKIRMKES